MSSRDLKLGMGPEYRLPSMFPLASLLYSGRFAEGRHGHRTRRQDRNGVGREQGGIAGVQPIENYMIGGAANAALLNFTKSLADEG